jgi:transposase
LAYKAEHVVDLESERILAAEIPPADQGDAQALVDRFDVEIQEVAADKGYHSAPTIELADDLGMQLTSPSRSRSTNGNGPISHFCG